MAYIPRPRATLHPGHVVKKDLIRHISIGTGLTTAEVAAVVDGLFGTIIKSLKQGNPVVIKGFGTWEVRRLAARNSYVPMLGKIVVTEPSNKIVFKPNYLLKKEMQRMPLISPSNLPSINLDA